MSIVKPFKALKHLAKHPHTVRYPYQEHRDIEGAPLPTERYRGFHSNNIETCIGCMLCAKVCPANAITYVKIENSGKKGLKWRPVIDYGRCCYCGFCTDICPTKSLILTPRYELVSKNIHEFKFIPTIQIREKKDKAIDISEVIFSPEEYKPPKDTAKEKE